MFRRSKKISGTEIGYCRLASNVSQVDLAIGGIELDLIRPRSQA